MKALVSPPAEAPTQTAMDTLLRPADLEAYAHEMPIATAVLPRLQSLLLSEQTNITDIVDLVMLDPGLAARVMQAAGSAVYGHRDPVRSLSEGLQRLGADEVYRVVAAFAMSKFLNRPLRTYGLGPAEYWRRSLACALVMVDLAPASGLDARVAYTVGLMHALGMIFIDRHLRCVGAPNLRFGRGPANAVPRQELMLTGMNHARAAAFVLRAWNFSEEIVEPIEHQLSPAGAHAHRAMASLLAEAREVALELAACLPPPGSTMTDPLRNLVGDEWRISIAEQILLIEGPAH
jgi:HD-like signal output (HDOD) protein